MLQSSKTGKKYKFSRNLFSLNYFQVETSVDQIKALKDFIKKRCITNNFDGSEGDLKWNHSNDEEAESSCTSGVIKITIMISMNPGVLLKTMKE